MKTLQGSTIYLRALEPEDLDALYAIENDENLWAVAETITPFSRQVLRGYLANAHKDIYETQQLRLAICEKKTKALVGFVDLFDFDPHNLKAGLGIVISKVLDRNKGYGEETLLLLLSYCKTHLKLHQVYANIEASNTASITLFEKMNFSRIGLKKDWRRRASIDGKEQYINEYFYQYIF